MMDMKSPGVDISSSRDPFQLERLAEELVQRETLASPTSTSPNSQSHTLPAYVPLSHTNAYLSSATFSLEPFLLSRLTSYTSLPDLRSELREYGAKLKEELVEMINGDYESFVSLGVSLRGEGGVMEDIGNGVGALRGGVEESRKELQIIQDAIQVKLKKRAALREEKAFLHLLLKISESIARLESLLLISLPSDEAEHTPEHMGIKSTGHEDDGHEDRSQANKATHLSRVASEYTQLLYHVSKAQEQKSAFVREMQWRIDRIKSTLSSDLDHLFASTLLALTSQNSISNSSTTANKTKPTKTTETEKAKLVSDLTECLRTYDLLGLWRDAEDVVRREVVRPFVKKTIFPGALDAPHSPILPHTPFPTRASNTLSHPLASPTTAQFRIPPRTPYTPFTAFASKSNPFDQSFGSSSSAGGLVSSVPLLDEGDGDGDGRLAVLFNRILRFVERDLGRVMDVAERVCVKSGSGSRVGAKAGSGVADKGLLGGGMSEEKEREGFEIMANVVWVEIGRAVMDELGSFVFAAGRPDEFRKNHETTQAFIRSLEYLCPSLHSIQTMRSHPLFTSFERRWQLPVYFQLRWKKIVMDLEEALVVTKIEHVGSNKDRAPFVTPQAAAVWQAVTTCWSAEVYIPDLGFRFWKFTLQLLSRYKTWLLGSLPPIEPLPKSQPLERAVSGSPAITRSVTPIPPPSETASVESIAADDALIRVLAVAITDILAMESQVRKLWREEVSMMLPDTDGVEGEDINPEAALDRALSGLTSLIPPMSNQIISILTKRSCEAVQAVRSIPASIRAMSMKRTPVEPSYFVPTILQPVKGFFGVGGGDGPGSALKTQFGPVYAGAVFESAVQRYLFWITSLRKTEESLRRLQKGKSQGLSFFGGSSKGRDDKGRDEERIRSQMILDVEAFGKDAASLGVSVEGSQSFVSLREMVYAAVEDG
ncbi:hypothetical protein JAAARDRAFT_177682 [Jaapia argillacea MUCL 33604]|uniref:Conserved oligomeric Golgi complex subunit 2 n=1 Tax=Jaapia argillacea MUCL 33604 TaxID=933084 RepID=A0A067PRP3_9AGAM|nr:hypothetical protein JAAARDRAFT_177682 [Jaapia argillacea MUCL 33604]